MNIVLHCISMLIMFIKEIDRCNIMIRFSHLWLEQITIVWATPVIIIHMLHPHRPIHLCTRPIIIPQLFRLKWFHTEIMGMDISPLLLSHR